MRQHHHLAAIRRVGGDLLVAGHAGVEDHLRSDVDARPKRLADKDRAVVQRQRRLAHRPFLYTMLPCAIVSNTVPRSVWPPSGEFFPLEKKRSVSATHAWSR